MEADKHFKRLIKDFKNIEFSNKKNILHKNKGENGLTYYGIYQSAHPNLPIWAIIQANIEDAHGDLEKASEYLSRIEDVQNEVEKFYFYNYYLKMHLNKIKSYDIVKKIFFFSIVQNSLKRPIKYAQHIVGVKEDGDLGNITANAINNYNKKDFMEKYITMEVDFFNRLVKKDLEKPKDKRKGYFRFLHGWLNRAFK
jgi:hypothetical protein